MYHRIASRILAVVLICVVGNAAMGQATRSPFTANGIGDIVELAQAHNQGNGGLGISNGNYWNLNNMNPALLPYNSLTVFSAGFVGGQRTVASESLEEQYTAGNLNYLVTAFPVKKGIWTTSIGLMPYSNVNYDFTYTSVVTGSNDVVEIRERGTGGFNQFYWSNGVALNKYLFVGLKATYIFSSIEKKFSNTIQNVGNVYTPVVTDRVTVSDFLLSGGLAFNADSIFNSKVKFKAGLTYDLGTDVNAKKFQSFDRTVDNRPPIATDTLIDNQSGIVRIPQAIGLGISFNRGLRWMIGMDVKMQKWSEYKRFDGSDGSFDDSFKITLGGEWTPDPSSVTSYIKRITYRIGGSYENTPYLVDNEGEMNQVKDFGINFGWSLPAGRFSSFDMAFRYGRRGSIDKTILEENYYRVYLGITFNDQWFIKRKYD
ncbi:hypothetical protein [Fulvivirga lutea]|uniref:Long-chain fatty acid transport protein n=1 Tax=Fulvivirga lutea TaxID=2810512 RepID=A0A975A2P0_9BACT|nr:hypothetical protein [Fulvivirga lutea]QSE98742.1 hypothetical protein JR347_06585 [Fulvivirga lutea]